MVSSEAERCRVHGWCVGLGLGLGPQGCIVDPRKLEHGFRRISARIPYTLPQGHEDNDVPTFWLLL